MQLATRKLLDRSFTTLGYLSIALMAAALLVILTPIFGRGMGAMIFKGTVEFRLMQLEKFERGDRAAIEAELGLARQARQPVYDMLAAFKQELAAMDVVGRQPYRDSLRELEEAVHKLLGPYPGEPRPVMPRLQYGQTRWDRALVKQDLVLNKTEYDYSNPSRMGVQVEVPRAGDFAGTSLAPLFPVGLSIRAS
jgi:phosphate transport system permease protein